MSLILFLYKLLSNQLTNYNKNLNAARTIDKVFVLHKQIAFNWFFYFVRYVPKYKKSIFAYLIKICIKVYERRFIKGW
jgi:hypothetical protein